MNLKCIALTLASSCTQLGAAPQDFAFTYQGELRYQGQPVDDQCDLVFSLYDLATGGAQVGVQQTLSAVIIAEGLFTAPLDFGDVYDGTQLYLEIAIGAGCGDAGASAETLPRTTLTSAPYSSYAMTSALTEAVDWSAIANRPAGLDDGDDDTAPISYNAGVGLTLSGNSFSVTGSYRLPQGCGNGQIASWNNGAWTCAEDQNSTQFWDLGGNAGTTPGTHFLGTADNQALELRVNGGLALRIEPTSSGEPNLIGGSGGNSQTGISGATIGGGADSLVDGDYATIGGGFRNSATANATVSGGRANDAIGTASTVSGGEANVAIGDHSAVLGGYKNVAAFDHNVIGGGELNIAGADSDPALLEICDNNIDDNNDGQTDEAGCVPFPIVGAGDYAIVNGGFANKASSLLSAVGGGGYNRANGPYSTVGGGTFNQATAGLATVLGGGENIASGDYAIAGGRASLASGRASTVSGGQANTASGRDSTVGGGEANNAIGDHSAVLGGYFNVALTEQSVIGGGAVNIAGADSDPALLEICMNSIDDDGDGQVDEADCLLESFPAGAVATVSGGYGNKASGRASAVGGGGFNRASDFASTIGGGMENQAIGPISTIGGGAQNRAIGDTSTIGGGARNEASGGLATVAGGGFNLASGDYSMAGGYNTHARLRGQQAFGSSTFSAIKGQSQSSAYTLSNLTIDVSPTRLYLDGASELLTLPEDMTMTFDIQVAATISGSFDFYGYSVRGVAQNDSGTIFLRLDTPFENGNVASPWSASVVVNSVDDSLDIEVIGDASTPVRWVATVRTTEVIFP